MRVQGELADLATAITIEEGHRDKLVLLDLRDFANRGIVAGFDPLAPHPSLSPTRQAASACSATRAAWGQETFDATPQLLRFLFVSYTAARFLGAGFEGAFRILQVESDLRQEAIASVPNALVRQELATLDALPPARRQEVTASATARLGQFLADPLITAMFSERERRLDFEDVLFGVKRRVCFMNLAVDQALGADAVRLIGRLLINHLLSLRQSRGSHVGRPTVLFVDEVAFLVTEDLVQVLDWGRSFGLHLIAAHQRLGQLRKEGVDLEDALLACAQTRVIFGNCLVRDLDRLAEETSLEEFSDRQIKDEITRVVFDPVEERRQTYSVTRSRGQSVALGHSESDTHGASEAESDGTSRSRGRSISAEETRGATTTRSEARSQSQSETMSRAMTRSNSETHSRSATRSESETESASRTDSLSETDSASSTDSFGETESHSAIFSQSETDSEGSSWSQITAHAHGTSDAQSSGASSGEIATAGLDGDVASIARSAGATSGTVQGSFASSSEASGISGSRGHATTRGQALALGHSTSRGRAVTRGRATTRGEASTRGHATTRGEAFTEGYASTASRTRRRSISSAPSSPAPFATG